MLTRFSTDPNKLTSTAQVKSYRAMKKLRADMDTLIQKSLQLDGTPADMDETVNGHAVIFQQDLFQSGDEFTGFVDAGGSLALETSKTSNEPQGPTTTKKTVSSRRLEETGEEIMDYEETVQNGAGRSKRRERFQINEAEGWALHQSDIFSKG